MDEDNPPMAFKASGNVYSREALLEMAGRNGGRCKDPRSGEECEFGELRKVFIS
jgi:macrophage erythroblast attacher